MTVATAETSFAEQKASGEPTIPSSYSDSSGYPMPTSISAAPTDLFDGELGDYELNEIPSLFNLDANQQMSAALEELGFSSSPASTAGDQDLPFVGNGNDGCSNPTGANNNEEQMENKRTAAEISEDDDESAASSKVQRVTRIIGTPLKADSATSSRIIAPKPIGTSKPKANKNGAAAAELGRMINTSTAHVKALVGAKGAAMCFEIVAGTIQDTTVPIPNLASTDLSSEEKSKFSRDRNRLHARNTRIRKKAYVDELKRTLDVLIQERDGAVAAKNRKVQVEVEEREVRFSVMEEYLRLRGSNEQTPARWSAILEDDVTMRLPNLDSVARDRSRLPSKKLVSGVRELMKECNSFSNQWMQSGSTKKSARKVSAGSLVFQCNRKSLLMESANVVMDWTATSTDPTKKEFKMRGTFRAKFNPQSNRLCTIDLVFDSSPLFAKSS